MRKSNFEQYQEFQDYTNYIEYFMSHPAPATSCLASTKISQEVASKSIASWSRNGWDSTLHPKKPCHWSSRLREESARRPF